MLNQELGPIKQGITQGLKARNKIGAFGSCALLAVSTVAVHAAEAESAIENQNKLEDVVVSAEWLGTPTKEQVRTFTGARTVVDSKALHESGAINIEDALRRVPGVKIQDETGTGALPNISIRGLNPARSSYVQPLVNEIPSSLAPYSHLGMSLFPVTLETIEAVDIVRGGVAVQYGPNNVGGVINFITKPIPATQTTTFKEALTIAEKGNVLSDTYFRSGGFVSDNLGLQLQLNTQQGESFRDHSDTEIYNILLDADWFIDANKELLVSLQRYDAQVELPGALSPEAYEQDRTQSQRPYDEFEGSTLKGAVTYKQSNENSEFQWMNFAHRSDRVFTFSIPFDPSLSPTEVRDTPRDFLVYGTEPRYTVNVGEGVVRQQISVGARYIKENVEYLSLKQPLGSPTQNTSRDWTFDTDAVALYISDSIYMMDRRLKVTPGIRYEHVDMNFTNNVNVTNENNTITEWLPGLSVGFDAKNDLFLFANAQRSLRAPQISQITRGGDVGAELAWNYEAGVRFSPVYHVDGTVTLFRIDFEDQIEFDSSSLSFRNLGETLHQGIETEVSWQPSSLPAATLSLGYTYLDTEIKTGVNKGNELPFASRHQATADIYYDVAGYQFNVNGTYLSKSFSDAENTKDEDVSGSVGEIPDYLLMNTAVSKEIYQGESSTATVTLAINNLFDKDYYFRGVDVSPIGRVPGAGRSYTIAGQIDF